MINGKIHITGNVEMLENIQKEASLAGFPNAGMRLLSKVRFTYAGVKECKR